MSLWGDRWLTDQLRSEVRDRIVANEKKTGAEIVVTVGLRSGTYRHVNAWVGAACSLAALSVYYFHPAELPDDVSLAVAVLCFPLGVVLASAVPPLRRLLVGKRERAAHVRREARARFVDQGITNTRGRTGVLIYVSLFERMVELVADTGIPVATMGTAWTAATNAMAAAVRKGDTHAFLTAMDQLGDALGAAVPRAADDVNELPDEVCS